MRFATSLLLASLSIAAWAAPVALVVNDFPSSVDWETVWIQDLQGIGITSIAVGSGDIDTVNPADHRLVVWNCGNETAEPLNATERQWIADALAAGRDLLLCAPGLPGDLIPDNRDWLTDNLGCDYVMPNSTITWNSIYRGHSVAGLPGTPLDGMEFDLDFGPSADVSADDLTLIHTTDARAFHLAEFTDLPGFLGVARETSRNRTAFVTFPIDSVSDTAKRTEIIQGLAEWLLRPREEGRGIWVVRNQLTSYENIDSIVEACADAGFNSLFVQVRGSGDAYYHSATEPSAEAIASNPPDFDPLQHMIEQAHANGLQVHAWLNTGYVWGTGTLPTNPMHVLNLHPEYVMVNRTGKSMMDYSPGEFDAQYSEGRFLSLAAPMVQDYLAAVFGELVSNYDLDGIHFDFIRYCARGVDEDYDLDYNALVVAAFQAGHGFDPHTVTVDSPEFEVWQEWQRAQVGALVGRIREEAHGTRPGIRVSAAVLSRYHLGRVQATQDWIDWLAAGQLDTACIMSYSSDNPLVVQEALLAQENRGQGTIWVGMGANHSIDDIIDRIDMVRDIVNPEGILFFPWGGFDSAELDRLRTDPFVAPATVPPVADDLPTRMQLN